MKKLSKKQKLIGFIAILIVAVIIAIVITTSVIRNNNQVANEVYAATSANAGSNLIANYILNGITIGGITGKMDVLNTSDATAKPEDIALGKTAYVDGKKITGTRIPDTNYDFKDTYGNVVKVPAGFQVVNPDDDVTKGIVIEDVSAGDTNTKGSQFVWIPVGDVITDSSGSKTTITLGRYTFASDGTETLVQSAENWSDTSNSVAISTYYKELASSTYGNSTAKDLEDFVTKATTSGGYYIGRYELGDATAINSQHSSSGTSNPVTCKEGVYPYNYITQPQASSLCQGMYSSSNFESDLINSYAWDTAIVFIQKFSGDTDYSQQIRLQTTLAKCGEAHSGSNYDVRCNIYDMAGNTFEWSTETSFSTDTPCVLRGGYYFGYYPSDRNYVYTTGSDSTSSARPTLYL